MGKGTQEILDEYENATNELAKAFTEKYFPEEKFLYDTWWVGNRVGDVYYVSDCFFQC